MNSIATGRTITSPGLILKRLVIIIVFLLACSVLLQSLKYVFHLQFTALNFLIFLFNVDQERNIPTFFSVILLLTASLMFYSIAAEISLKKERYRYHWWIMAILFFLVAGDEFMATHEMISEIIRDKYDITGFLYYAWVIPFGALVVALGIFYSGFVFRHLPAKTRNFMLMSAFLYVGGSLGMEMLGSYFFLKGGTENMINAILTAIEEGMEMAGVAVFIFTLADYHQSMGKDIKSISIKKKISTVSRVNPEQRKKKVM
jgi:hypothetical protein